MRKSTQRIRNDIAKMQEQLKAAETRDAERIGRIALKAGLAEIEIDDADLQAAFEDVAKRFRGGKDGSSGKKRASTSAGQASSNPSGEASGGAGEG
ncbi:putative unusual protein kinase regulating ubiquinone biosynthesis (AarF/ABC1/UbiB family) [Mycoplana sp. BE70]|uniref:conjugal transfer protein TraC n=1 Tax=Mycoplana sp. BE70 TaxID=2817775 RepID=UPI0028604A59|nr:conjugal transfer protein TraC [Mycoplana sp. BE70]MDR6758731.1 putative unusual protein kinase regulating ubiquinone biosynthesis (AarF/ABC1/UbiB family) [Mycoplana sp. BE70]